LREEPGKEERGEGRQRAVGACLMGALYGYFRVVSTMYLTCFHELKSSFLPVPTTSSSFPNRVMTVLQPSGTATTLWRHQEKKARRIRSS
jgi:hypothetical protein